jgi:predicted TIM-barrel fold metal-dependent hydrolase
MSREPKQTRFEMYLERARKRRAKREAWREKYKELKATGMSVDEIKAHPSAPKAGQS